MLASERVEWREREGHMLEGGSLHIPPPRFYPGGEGFFFLFTGRELIFTRVYRVTKHSQSNS